MAPLKQRAAARVSCSVSWALRPQAGICGLVSVLVPLEGVTRGPFGTLRSPGCRCPNSTQPVLPLVPPGSARVCLVLGPVPRRVVSVPTRPPRGKCELAGGLKPGAPTPTQNRRPAFPCPPPPLPRLPTAAATPPQKNKATAVQRQAPPLFFWEGVVVVAGTLLPPPPPRLPASVCHHPFPKNYCHHPWHFIRNISGIAHRKVPFSLRAAQNLSDRISALCHAANSRYSAMFLHQNTPRAAPERGHTHTQLTDGALAVAHFPTFWPAKGDFQRD